MLKVKAFLSLCFQVSHTAAVAGKFCRRAETNVGYRTLQKFVLSHEERPKLLEHGKLRAQNIRRFDARNTFAAASQASRFTPRPPTKGPRPDLIARTISF